MGSLPDRLAGIPLEYFGDAIRWLQDRPSVRGDRLGVIGTSRGGELALLLGAHYPDLAAVVSYVGSILVFSSLAGHEPAWTFRGKPLPWISNPFDILQVNTEQFEKATRIPSGACSACSMDVYGVLALRRPATTCIAFEWSRIMPTPHLRIPRR
jgi:pimeloyl-ACP methyl ester carboxylesterase